MVVLTQKRIAQVLFFIALVFLANGSAKAEDIRLLIFGDSLVAGYGVARSDAFPSQLERALKSEGVAIEVINGGISGETMAGGASRIDWALEDNLDGVMVVLGGNDALRGLSPQAMERSLDSILLAIERKRLPVLVAGMKAPLNMGASYGKQFDTAFMNAIKRAKARGDEIIFYPFFLAGVALNPRFNQLDGIHPNRAGVNHIVERMLPSVKVLLQKIEEQSR